MALIVSPQVETELDEIWLYIASESSSIEIADRVIDSITERFLELARNPYLGRKREDLRPGLGSVTAGSYVVIYRVDVDDVKVLHVLHGRRDIVAILRQ
jgi:toxin ParE1/3/4